MGLIKYIYARQRSEKSLTKGNWFLWKISKKIFRLRRLFFHKSFLIVGSHRPRKYFYLSPSGHNYRPQNISKIFFSYKTYVVFVVANHEFFNFFFQNFWDLNTNMTLVYRSKICPIKMYIRNSQPQKSHRFYTKIFFEIF